MSPFPQPSHSTGVVIAMFFYSKTDERSEGESLGFLLPAHEYFHQSMVVADCENELFRDTSRGLEGGAFFAATILNRKEAKTQKGKDAIDDLKDFILLKSDARFCQFFMKKHDLDPSFDNTPDLMKSASYDDKEAFVHGKVEETLRDLIPYFRGCHFEDPKLDDHPLQDGRRAKHKKETLRKESFMDQLKLISEDTANQTVQQIHTSPHNEELIELNMETISLSLSGTRSKLMYKCKLCSFQSRYKTVSITHIETCIDYKRNTISGSSDNLDNSTASSPNTDDTENNKEVITNDDDDMYWNYKSCEFYVDAIFSVTTVFEKFGDGLGCFIVNKLLLPILYGLKHSNYTNSIHRFITRVLCEATPKEALKLVHERFSNRVGKPGHNIPRDRRMEYRIGTAKKLIGNLGPNFNQESVQQVNKTLEVKEDLFLKTRNSHGVDIRQIINFSMTNFEFLH